MAGLASSFTFKPLLSNPHKPISLNSNPFGLRLYNPTSTSLVYSTSISARYGGGGGGGGRGRGSAPFRRAPTEEDQALDISTIRSDKVRLIDAKQNMVGIVSKMEAIQMAEDAELNLVILSPEADPPVLKIMDYDKYRYEVQKKKKEQQKKNAASRMDLKELKMGYNIDVHDYTVRLKAAKKFLNDGDKVKVIVNLKGRISQFRNNAIELLRRFQTDVGELATEETKNFSDRNIFLILVPNKVKPEEVPKKKKPTESEEVSVSVSPFSVLAQAQGQPQEQAQAQAQAQES